MIFVKESSHDDLIGFTIHKHKVKFFRFPPEILGSSAGRLARRFWRADTGMKTGEETDVEVEGPELTCWREKGEERAVWSEGALPVLWSVM